ncbi:hypothetical protein Q7P37_002155 [Cladosporium fusiforme]
MKTDDLLQYAIDHELLKSPSFIDTPFRQLHRDTKPLKLYARNDARPFYIQKALVESCYSEALTSFSRWLLRQDLVQPYRQRTQMALAQAWKFGAEFHLTKFQNEVMHELVKALDGNYAKEDAVREAYTGAQHTLLRQLFIKHLAHDYVQGQEVYPDLRTMGDCGGFDGTEFYKDLSMAMWESATTGGHTPAAGEYLVEE